MQEWVSAHYGDVLLQKSVVHVDLSFTLGPLDFKSENAGIFSKDVSLQFAKVQVFWWLALRFIVLVPDVVAAPEEFLLLVRDRNDDGGGACIAHKVPMISS